MPEALLLDLRSVYADSGRSDTVTVVDGRWRMQGPICTGRYLVQRGDPRLSHRLINIQCTSIRRSPKGYDLRFC